MRYAKHLLMCVGLLAFGAGAFAQVIIFDTELTSMDLHGDAAMPLGPDRTAILTGIHLTESGSLQSLGRVTATAANPGGPYDVQSFFDVFFDITFTDTDPAVNFFGLGDGASLSFTSVGPAHLENAYVATFDQNAPSYGLFPPPEASPYSGSFDLVIPLGADLDGNGENDVIKFLFGILTALDANRSFIIAPDGTVVDFLDTTFQMEGGVMDASADPPFSFELTGPTTATSRLMTDSEVPEPASVLLLGFGLLCLVALRRKPAS